MIKKWSIRYPAVGGEEERRAYVYLPTMYDADPGRRYPVLYMFDGQNVFFDEDATYGKSWGVADYLDYTDTPLIVAAVECNAGANNERLVEYSPYRFDDKQYGHFDGKGKDTLFRLCFCDGSLHLHVCPCICLHCGIFLYCFLLCLCVCSSRHLFSSISFCYFSCFPVLDRCSLSCVVEHVLNPLCKGRHHHIPEECIKTCQEQCAENDCDQDFDRRIHVVLALGILH